LADVRVAVDELPTLIMFLTAAIWRKHFGDNMETEKPSIINGAPALYEFVLPFFLEVQDEADV
jgi:hypothetical protein